MCVLASASWWWYYDAPMLLKVKIGKGEIFFLFFLFCHSCLHSHGGLAAQEKKTSVLSRLSAVSTAIAVPLVLCSTRVSQKGSPGSISFSPAFSTLLRGGRCWGPFFTPRDRVDRVNGEGRGFILSLTPARPQHRVHSSDVGRPPLYDKCGSINNSPLPWVLSLCRNGGGDHGNHWQRIIILSRDPRGQSSGRGIPLRQWAVGAAACPGEIPIHSNPRGVHALIWPAGRFDRVNACEWAKPGRTASAERCKCN